MMPEALSLGAIDWLTFGGYLGLLSIIGYVAGRAREPADASSSGYFLAGRSLPWYVVGSSYIAANISIEHFIGLIGAAYIYGIAVATGEWSTVIAFTFLIWLFIPFLLGAGVFTTPEYLERRFNAGMRAIFATVTVAANIFAFLGPVIYGGGLVVVGTLGLAGGNALQWAILALGFAAGLWAIWGGLKSIAWMDTLTLVVKVGGGLTVTIAGLLALGDGSLLDGAHELIVRNQAQSGAWAVAASKFAQEMVGAESYDRLSVIQPLTHETNPWTHWVFSFFYVGLWYTVINQFLVQRILAARSMYDARMGMTLASFLKLLLPFIVVVPGLIWFALHPEFLAEAPTLSDVRPIADQTYVQMVEALVPIGLRGVLLAALFGAIQSTVSGVLTSTSTILTLDVYKRFVKPGASEAELVRLGRILTALVLALAVGLAIWISSLKLSLFVYMQELYTFFAPPFSAVFLLGILWRRVTGRAALVTVIAGFAFGIGVKLAVQGGIAPAALAPYSNQGLLNWGACMLLCAGLSLVTAPPRADQITDSLTFNWRTLDFGAGLEGPWWRSVAFWSPLSVVLMFGFVILFSVIV